MRILFSLIALLTSTLGTAAGQICAQNFVRPDGNPCAVGSRSHAYLIGSQDPGKRICAKIYQKSMCSSNTEAFVAVPAKDGETVCIVNFNQDVTGNYCASNPQSFDYVKGFEDL